jgi:hypothetical protein
MNIIEKAPAAAILKLSLPGKRLTDDPKNAFRVITSRKAAVAKKWHVDKTSL